MAKFLLLFVFLISGSVIAQTTQPATQPSFRVGRIDDPAIPESSGLVASRKYAGVFWTHNDSGNPAMIFAVDRTGKTLASFKVDARNTDWEDIAIDDAGHLYLADTGNNKGKRTTVNIFQIDEPDPTQKPAGDLKVTCTWQLTYPQKPFDCESFFVWSDVGYVISKDRDGTRAGLYRFPLAAAEPTVLEKVGDLPIRFPVTAADISRDGNQVAVLSVGGPYLFDLAAVGDVKSMTTRPARSVFFTDPNMEAVTFITEGLLVTNEKRAVMLFRWKDFGPKP